MAITDYKFQRGLPTKEGLYWLRVRESGKKYIVQVGYHRTWDDMGKSYWYAAAFYPFGNRDWFELNAHDFELCSIPTPE